jgi:predicted RNA-binding protein YlqC (UPF0109 family)
LTFQVNFSILETFIPRVFWWRHAAAVERHNEGMKLEIVTTVETAMADTYHDQEFVESLVRAIVNHPNDVRTDRIVDERGVLITLHINPEDMGYVIGRQGQTARSIRTLLKIVGAKENARVNLKIYEPEGSRRPHREDRDMVGSEDSFRRSDDDTSVDDLGI